MIEDVMERTEVAAMNTIEEKGREETNGLNKIEIMVVGVQRTRGKQKMPRNISASG
jgi:hypothetical protein